MSGEMIRLGEIYTDDRPPTLLHPHTADFINPCVLHTVLHTVLDLEVDEVQRRPRVDHRVVRPLLDAALEETLS